MEDAPIHDRIEQLVAEEHDLYERAAQSGLSDAEHQRLESIKVGLDQSWTSSASDGPCARPASIPTQPTLAHRRWSKATSSSGPTATGR